MVDSIIAITLDLQETSSLVVVKAKKGDTGRILRISLSDVGTPYTIAADCYAVFSAKKPDGTKINNACTIENNVIEYEFTEQTCTAVGTMKAEIRLYGADDKTITSACFLVNVYDTVFRDGDEVGSETEMNTLDDLILRANAFLNETGKLLRWHGNWDSETEYETNDLVLHEQVLYVAEEAVAVGTVPGSEEVTAWVPIAGMGTGSGGTGLPGENGATFTPAVTQEGMLSWTNDKGQANPSPINIMGPQGEKGEKGEKGDKGDTGATGPQGEAGPEGPQGPQGEKGETGAAGPVGPAGADGTGVTILGSFDTPEELNATYPTGSVGDSYLIGGHLYVWSATAESWEDVGSIQGPEGPQGPQGETGPQGERGPQGETGPQGEPGMTAFDYAVLGGYSGTEADFKRKMAAEYLPVSGGDIAGSINMKGYALSGLNTPTKDDEAATKGSSESFTNNQITDRVIYGKGKNLLKNTAKSQTISGVTFTVNEDGSITANGMATSDIYLNMATATLNVQNQYTLTGSPNLGDSLAAALYVNTEIASGNGWNYNQPATFSVKASGSFNINLYIKSGYTANNLTFYPMIRLASETDDTYEPYYEGLMESVSKSQVVNNFTTTEEGFVADARALNVLNDRLSGRVNVYVYDEVMRVYLMDRDDKNGLWYHYDIKRKHLKADIKIDGNWIGEFTVHQY